MTPSTRCLLLLLTATLYGVAAQANGDTPPPPAPTSAEARNWWSFRPPQRPPDPTVRDAAWPVNAVDRFILSRLEAANLRPAPAADRRTLIRRVTYDLIGLPPTPAEVDAFVDDKSPDAYDKLIDRLLANPLYGQRWARHWLDVVRYTDSFDARGIGSDGDCREAWRYRDWVVDALNRDLPYDQFVKNQIAGDLLPAAGGGDVNAEGIIATGVYVFGEWGGGDADRDKMITDIVDDQVDVTGRAFMGLTIACARCHDHKFDPLSIDDYYGLAGIFFSSRFLPDVGSKTSGGPLLRRSLSTPDAVARKQDAEAAVASLQAKLDAELDAHFAALGKQAAARVDEYLMAAWDLAHPAAGSPARADKLAADRKLDPRVLESLATLGAPAPKVAMNLLKEPRRNVAGRPGLSAWGNPGRDTPSVTANADDAEAKFVTITLPPKSFAVHPSPSAGVAVAWKVPAVGIYRVSGRVADGDGTCGDGIDWRLTVRRTDGRAEPLARGSIGNGGAQSFADVTGGGASQVLLAAGDFVELAVFPKGEYTCDTTVCELDVAEAAGDKSWRLAQDVASDLAAANPHADRFGNAAVWYFYDLAGAPESSPFAADPLLATWRAAVAAGSARGAVAAAAGVRAATADGKAEAKSSTLIAGLTDPRGPIWSKPRSDVNALDPAAKARVEELRKSLEGAKRQAAEAIPVALGLSEGGTPKSMFPGIQDVPVHLRGRYDKLGDVVPRRFPVVLAGSKQSRITEGSGRLQLARWIATADHPLTARVMVNRIWQHHFVEGIVRTPNNFGKLGTPPTHPELLDWLATEFVNSGWSVKAMHRLILKSATYRQSSEGDAATASGDPENLLLGRQNRRRLEAEALRDALLSVGGNLDTTPTGPAVPDLAAPRRTLYLRTIRSDRSNYRMLFDAADPVSIVEKRVESTVAPQALFLLNHPFAIAQADLLAGRVMAEGGADLRARVTWLYRMLYARVPDAAEIAVAERVIGGRIDDRAAWQQYAQVLLCANEFIYVD